jgi:copper ion binding protein
MGLFGSRNKTTLNLEGMSCGHCAMRVTKALEGVKGVKSASVNLDKKKVDIEFSKARVEDEILIAAVEKAGYKATK